jgi:hypothetical protein
MLPCLPELLKWFSGCRASSPGTPPLPHLYLTLGTSLCLFKPVSSSVRWERQAYLSESVWRLGDSYSVCWLRGSSLMSGRVVGHSMASEHSSQRLLALKTFWTSCWS